MHRNAPKLGTKVLLVYLSEHAPLGSDTIRKVRRIRDMASRVDAALAFELALESPEVVL